MPPEGDIFHVFVLYPTPRVAPERTQKQHERCLENEYNYKDTGSLKSVKILTP